MAAVICVCGCGSTAGGSAQAEPASIPEPTQTPWIIEQTVIVTRFVEVAPIPTALPATAQPTVTPLSDLAGARDLAIVPRPPQAVITRYATARKHLFLDYAVSANGPSASKIAEYYTSEMEGLGWELTRVETEDERFSLTFEPADGAPELMSGVDYARILVRGDMGQVAVVLNTLAEVSDWSIFLAD
jgi:hypothetical protein